MNPGPPNHYPPVSRYPYPEMPYLPSPYGWGPGMAGRPMLPFDYAGRMPPPMPAYPPYEPYNNYSPFNPMLVHQTNNYYDSNFMYQPEPPAVTSNFQTNGPSLVQKRAPEVQMDSAQIVVKKESGKGKKMAEIINLDESDQPEVSRKTQKQQPAKVQPPPKTQPISKPPKPIKKVTQPRRMKQVKQVRNVQQIQLIPELIQLFQPDPQPQHLAAMAPLRQLERPMKGPILDGQIRRSKRTQVKKPERLRQVEEQAPEAICLRSKRLVFGFPMNQEQKLQLCLSKLREITPQILSGHKYQAKMPGLLHSKDLSRFLAKKRGHLKNRLFS